MNTQKKVFWETVDVMNKAGALPYLLVIGSWAEYLYESYFDNFTSNLKTMDVDFLIKNKNKPTQQINIPKIMEDNNYVQNIDGWGVMRYSKDALLEIEFLLRELGPGQSEPYDVKSFNLKVEALRYMDILVSNELMINTNGYNIYVPQPSAYALHKMVIHNKRKTTKKEKDKASITNVIESIKNNNNEYKNLQNLFITGLTKKEKAKVKQFIEDNLIDVKIF
jgi:hypothetical protein